MIKIKIARDEHGISLISMHGHAEYDQYGKDIVCSAASTIIIGGINAIAQLGYLSFISYKVDAGDVELKINNTECAELQIILNTLLVQFQSIEESYPKYIQVRSRFLPPARVPPRSSSCRHTISRLFVLISCAISSTAVPSTQFFTL